MRYPRREVTAILSSEGTAKLHNSPNNRSSTAVRSVGVGLGPEDLFLHFEFFTFCPCSRVPFSAQLHCHLTLSF